MNWLQARLKELGLTHDDLRQALAERGIERVRATITGWTHGKPISLFNNPEQTRILAETLEWSTTEMLIAAGYDITPPVPDNLLEALEIFAGFTEAKKKLFLFGLGVITEFTGNLPDDILNDINPRSGDGDEAEDTSDEA